MFYEELSKVKKADPTCFDFKIFYEINKSHINNQLSSVLVNDDYIIINLKGEDDLFCPIIIHLGINNSKNYYSLYLNEKAIVYNYEKFDTFSLFEKELYHFLSNTIRAELLMTPDNAKIYTDYFITDYVNKEVFSFREYHKETWWNFFGLRKTKKKIDRFRAWLG